MAMGKKELRQARTWLDVSIVGIQFPVAIALGFFWGRWLDRHLGTWPWLTAVFTLFGITAGFVNLFRITAAAGRSEAEEARLEREEARGDEGGDDDGVAP
jgi:F0F1-type ATP synthase assembly protein I